MFGTFSYKPIGNGNIRILGTWASENIGKVKIPQLIGVEGAPKDGIIQFHKKGIEQIEGFFDAVESEGLKHLVISWAGSFFPRMVRGSSSALSNHSWGTAFDINAPQNWLNAQPAPEGKKGTLLRLVPIANDFGFFWGGHYRNRLDGMHFELAKLNMTPAKYFDLAKNSASASDTDVKPDLPVPQIPITQTPTTTINARSSMANVSVSGSPLQQLQAELAEEKPTLDIPQVSTVFPSTSQELQQSVDSLNKQPQNEPHSQTIPIVAGGEVNANPSEVKREGVSWQSAFSIYWKEIAGLGGMVFGFLQDNWIYIVIGLALIAIAAYLYNQSKQRAKELNEKKLEIASNPQRINSDLL